MKALLLALLFTGCSWSNVAFQNLEPTFVPYVEKFQHVCGVPVYTSIALKDMAPGHLGHCANYGANSFKNHVDVNRLFWHNASEIQREMLIFHELGHCVLDRRHKDGLTQVGGYPNGPISLMHPMPYGYEMVFENNRAYYYKELCNGKI